MAAEVLERVPIRTVVNGVVHDLSVAPDQLLVDLLRDELGLTGTKVGCSVGVCGLCSVLLDGAAVTACLMPALRADGREVTTIEGLSGPDGELTAVQEAFLRQGGLQCGICTPGQVIAATALIAERPDVDEAAVREYLTGHLCRCTGYYGIVAAVLAAAGGAPATPLRPPPTTPAAETG